jgi:L-rhamnose isomerase/sugar isomerase
VKTVIERLGDLQLQVSSNSFARGSSSFASYRTDTDPSTLEDRLKAAGVLAQATGRCRKVSLHAPSDIRTDEDAQKTAAMLKELGLESGAFYPELYTPRKGGVLNHRLMHGSLSSPHTDVRVASINYAIRSMEMMRALGCRQMVLWIPDGIDTPGERNLTDMLDRIMNGVRQIGLNIRKSENMLIDFRPYDPSYCSMAVSDWGTAAWICRETDPSFRVMLDTSSLLPGASLDSIVVAMLRQRILGCVRLSDNRLGQGVLPAGTIDPAALFRFFVNILQAEKAGLCSIGEMLFEIAVNARSGDPTESVLRAVENVETAFASAMLVNPDELAEQQNKPDNYMAEKLLQDAYETDMRPVIRAWREEKGLKANPVEVVRASRIVS